MHSLRQTVGFFAAIFVPIGLGIWIAHYGFHFLIGVFSIVPVFQTFLIDHGITLLGQSPNWALTGVDENITGLAQMASFARRNVWQLFCGTVDRPPYLSKAAVCGPSAMGLSHPANVLYGDPDLFAANGNARHIDV